MILNLYAPNNSFKIYTENVDRSKRRNGQIHSYSCFFVGDFVLNLLLAIAETKSN